MLEKPVAIVTGAGRGIGKASAEELSRAGYAIALVSRTASELQQCSHSLTPSMCVPADVSQSPSAAAIVNSVMDKWGRIDALVNCAGLALWRSLEQATDAEWRSTLDANLSSAFYLCRAVWPIFKRQKSGVVVNISSLASRDPFSGLGLYGAAKAGLNLLGLSLARDGAASRIRVHTIAPGAVETRMLREIVSDKDLPTEATMAPAEVAKVVRQCVDGTLGHTSGEVIYLHKLPSL